MRAVVIVDGHLEIQERPVPVPGDGEVLIRVRAAGINGADIMQRAGNYPPPPGAPPDIPGLECAGETERGDHVMALLPGGGHAELVAVHESHVLPVPETVSWPEAGGFVEVFATAHDALFTQAQLMPGERLLVHGAAGGVGIAGVQLGSEAGATVSGIARHHLEQVLELGAADTKASGNYDVILELVGGDYLRTNLERLGLKGRLALIGLGAGGTAEVNFHLLLRARGRIHGSTLRARPRAEKADVIRRLREDVLPLLGEGRIVVPVHATYPLDKAQEAYDAFAAGGKFGKIVLIP
ncbi:MAG TPA: zinc-binding dehydrogenase [Gaiellaceae bacterium]|jgi:NADPH:quinone reductase-like Zn-dependent oxidoreductase|nr:zinc-binding dehydrogenase [Gaiellaceae bacterium]